MSYLSQMGALAVQNFASAAVGIAVAVALIRGFCRRGAKTIGNFWVDLIRGTIYILLPIAFLSAIVFIGQGALQTLTGPAHVHDVLNGVSQVIPRGPVASQESIKQLGTNGGGFFNANGADPFENPTGLTNFLSIVLILCIPVALTYTFGKMVGSIRQGAAILAVMAILFGSWLAIAAVSEHQANPAVAAAGLTQQRTGNTEGKEIRFGDTSSALYATASTQTSTGSVDSAEDSYTPMGGFAVLTGMMLGEVSPGGVGSGGSVRARSRRCGAGWPSRAAPRQPIWIASRNGSPGPARRRWPSRAVASRAVASRAGPGCSASFSSRTWSRRESGSVSAASCDRHPDRHGHRRQPAHCRGHRQRSRGGRLPGLRRRPRPR